MTPQKWPIFGPFLDHFWKVLVKNDQKWTKNVRESDAIFSDRKSLENHGFLAGSQKMSKNGQKSVFFHVQKTRFFRDFFRTRFFWKFWTKWKVVWNRPTKFWVFSKPEKRGSKRGSKSALFGRFWDPLFGGSFLKCTCQNARFWKKPRKNPKITFFTKISGPDRSEPKLSKNRENPGFLAKSVIKWPLWGTLRAIFARFSSFLDRFLPKMVKKGSKNGPKLIKNGSFLVDPVFGGYLIN